MWWALVLLVAGGHAREFSDHEIYELPELYQIDDYDRCLSRPGALYCVGTFRLTADQQTPSHHYRMIEDYSSDLLHFDRRLLHRGVCVSSRCSSTGSNSSELFFDCVREHEKQLGMHISLETHKCDVSSTSLESTKESYDQIFVWIVGIILVLNVIGTLYDTFIISEKKNRLLLTWSIPHNWKRLTKIELEKDGSYSPLSLFQGIRIWLMLAVVSTHVLIVSHEMFLFNPRSLEKVYEIPIMMMIRNGTGLVQTLVMITNMLFTYQLIQTSKRRIIGFREFPKHLMYRFIRLMPIHMLVVGFAATWWRYTGDGPLWADVVEKESDVCRRKFLVHMFFLHNFIDNNEQCLIQTWYLAVDIQMYAVASLVLIALMTTKSKPLPILSSLFVCSVVSNGLLAYYNGWSPPVSLVNPELFRKILRGSKSFQNYYMAPWGSLPACFLGIIMGYLYEEIRERGLNFNNNKLFVWVWHMSLPLLVSWVMTGAWAFEQQDPLYRALYVATERPVICLLLCIFFLGIATSPDNIVRRMLSWRGWHALGRLSLPVLMVHWCIIKTFMAPRRSLTDYTLFYSIIETCSTFFFSYCLALPLTLLVEMPLMKTFTSVLMD